MVQVGPSNQPTPKKTHPDAEPRPYIQFNLRLTAIYTSAALIRLVLFFFTSLPEVLVDRLELTTPLTSFRRPLGYTAADLLSAHFLSRIWDARRGREKASDVGNAEGDNRWKAMVVFLFLFNPYTLLTALSRSTTTLDNLFVIAAVYFAVLNKPVPSTFFLAISTLTSLYSILLLPFIVMIRLEFPSCSSTKSPINRAGWVIGFFIAWLGFLVGGEWLMLGLDWEGIMKGPSMILGITDLTPNVGLSWYFFTEMFDHFRPFFTFVFQIHIVSYIVPLLLTFPHDPLFALGCFQLIVTLLKTYPTLGDSSLSLGLLGLFPETMSHFESPLIPTAWTAYALLLLPLLSHLWLTAASGNANFFYAAGLVYGLSGALVGIGVVWAGRKKAFLGEFEVMGEGKGEEEREKEGLDLRDGGDTERKTLRKREGVWEVLQLNS